MRPHLLWLLLAVGLINWSWAYHNGVTVVRWWTSPMVSEEITVTVPASADAPVYHTQCTPDMAACITTDLSVGGPPDSIQYRQEPSTRWDGLTTSTNTTAWSDQMNSAQTLLKAAMDERKAGRMEQKDVNYMLGVTQRNNDADEQFMARTRQATVREYAKWVRGHLGTGGTLSHTYDYNMSDDFVVITSEPCHITPLYGVNARQIIVPAGITCTLANRIGHNNVFFMRDFTHVGLWVPMYEDVAAHLAGGN